MHGYLHFSSIALLVLLSAGCVPRSAGPSSSAAARDDLLLVGSQTGISAVQPLTGAMPYTAPGTALSPDRSRLLDVRTDGALTRVTAIESASGREGVIQEVAGSFGLGAISTNGRFVAVVEGEPRGYPGHLHPVGREHTALVVVDTTAQTEPRRFEVDGNVEPEAFAFHEQSLFVIDYLPPSAPDRYRVRQLDLHAGTVAAVQTRSKSLVEEEMRGQGRQQVYSPDRKVLYTLYLKEDDHVHARNHLAAGGGGQPSGAQAFVHVLNLQERWAFCLDLPHPFGAGPAHAHALAVSPDGGSLYVVGSSGSIAVADTRTLQLRQRVKQFRDESGGHPVVASGGGGFLYVASGDRLLAVDSSTLAVVGSHTTAGPISAVELSADGRRLYVGLLHEVAVLDVRTWQRVASLPAGGARSIVRAP